jgi:hypothetical protein
MLSMPLALILGSLLAVLAARCARPTTMSQSLVLQRMLMILAAESAACVCLQALPLPGLVLVGQVTRGEGA